MTNKVIITYIALLFIFFNTPGEASTIKAKKTESPKRNYHILFYDNEFLFVGRDFGSHKDPRGKTEPGLFVHSKKLDKWLLITEISTEGAKLSKSSGLKSKEDEKKMMMCSVSWDLTNYIYEDFIEVPLKTSGSIAFPEKVIFNQEKNKYLLIFFSSWEIDEVETILEFKKDDLKEEFKRVYKP